MTKWKELLYLLKQAAIYGHTSSLLAWDVQTYMPKDAGPGRDGIFAFMATKTAEKLQNPRVGDILAELADDAELDQNQRRFIARMTDICQRTRAVPLGLVRALAEATSRAEREWRKARKTSSFAMFLPHLIEVFSLVRAKADAIGFSDHPYDALLPDFEPGMTAKMAKETLLPLRQPLSELVRLIGSKPAPEHAFLKGYFPPERQLLLAGIVARRCGFDFDQGRLDQVPGHPMTITTGPKDTRITTRLFPQEMSPGLFAAIHETGHALYCQGMDSLFDWVFLDTGLSMAIHESQSRMFENIVGRSLPFWKFFFPTLQAMFAPSFDDVSAEQLWKAVNVVKPSLIRIEADEATYNLHILLRMELEMAMLDRSLNPADLPEAWNAKMEEYLGIRPDNDANGCMQDIHWSHGYCGYFPTYALGNLLSAQLWATIEQEIPGLADEIARGNLGSLLEWLRKNVHQWGPVYTLPELTQQVTGQPLNPEIWLAYINNKYAQVYDL
ncbi:carboxypeptidase M32 [Candidatus Parcubacteria bacterium]|nr:carboxypeptidase M32 [Patescibacteria group bacterium]MBU4466615.1 carboxypeptidase M32 [Patescibacteria group bacterium]MCG2688359.1 carboxypeptidase M32 [Candidatus Parcubacteria bacterium]